MAGVDTRSDSRDSFFLLASITVECASEAHRVRVRNLSDGGMMGEGEIAVRRGDRLAIDLGKVGQVGGTVAWVQGRRFGVAFDHEVDSERARRPVLADSAKSRAENDVSWFHRTPAQQAAQPERLRKV